MTDLYPLPPFQIENRDHLIEIMRRFPLATIMSGTAGSATMTLLPLLVDEAEDGTLFLTGHLDINNPHSAFLDIGNEVSFLFNGPNSYASPDLYPSRQLPGWLYLSIQGHGTVEASLTDEELTQALVTSTERFGATDQQFNLDPTDPRIPMFLPEILGFRIKVTAISGIAKLAQDKGAVDSARAVDFLADQTNAGLKELFTRLSKATAH